MSANGLETLASEIVRRAMAAGATGAESSVSEGDEFSVDVRMGEVEKLTESGARGASLRTLLGHRAGSSYTSDLSSEGLDQMVRSALGLAQIAADDPFAGLPDPAELGALAGDLDLYADDIERLDTREKTELAREAEQSALRFDTRIVNSDGATFGSWTGRRAFANSFGFSAEYRASNCSLWAVPVAREREGSAMERDHWHSSARSASRLEAPAEIGRKAAERAVRRLGGRKVATQKAPIVFDSRAARGLLSRLFEAVSGTAVYRGASFLADKMGQRVAAESVTLVDDATMRGLLGSFPFDGEGVRSRRTVVIERGVLQSWLLDSYSARKLGLKTTGNAARDGGVSHGNLYLEPGALAPERIIASVRNGFYVTELIGFGVNIVTGDYSQGATGLWIENGELSYPVSGVTIAGQLGQMLSDIEQVGSDLEFRGSVASPTLLVREMTISGS